MGSGKTKLSRRSFIRKTAGLAAGAAAASKTFTILAASAEGGTADDRPFKLGIIGCGWQGKVLMRNAMKVPGNKFTAICDIVPKRRKEAQQIAGGKAKEFEDYQDLLKNADIDAVLIATPLHMHHPIVMEAFKNKRDVFCEKAMARTIEQCKEMLRAQGDRVLQIGHHLRYHPIYHIAKHDYIARDMLGKINNIHCQWNRNTAWRRPPEKDAGAVDFKKWGYDKPDQLWNWRLYRKFSGGLMTELASHQLDVVNWFLDDKTPVAIHGVGRTDHKDGRTIFDNDHLIFEYPDNVQVTYESITTNAYNPFGWEAYEMIQGNKGTLIMTHLGPKFMGIFFREQGVPEPLWFPMAHKINFDTGNIIPREYKTAVVIGKPTSKEQKIAGIPIMNLVGDDNKPLKSTYELEMIGFKKSVLDRTRPFCDGYVGMKSAIPALLGDLAMEKQERLVVPKDIFKL